MCTLQHRRHHDPVVGRQDGVATRQRGVRLLVRVGRHAVRAETLSVREREGVPTTVSRRFYRRGLVLFVRFHEVGLSWIDVLLLIPMHGLD